MIFFYIDLALHYRSPRTIAVFSRPNTNIKITNEKLFVHKFKAKFIFILNYALFARLS